ncbi:MAG: ATP-binding protein, partial [Myxococcales bacterium]
RAVLRDCEAPGVRAWVGEKRFVRPGGEVVWSRISAAPVRDADGRALFLVGHVEDVTGQLRSARELSRQAELLRERAELLELMDDAVLVRDLDGRVLYWNRGAENLFGWSREEALGRDASELLRADLGPQAREQLLRDGKWSGELLQWHRDGRELVVSTRCALHRDGTGAPATILIGSSDVTERRRLEARVQLSERMASVGLLAAGVAHEINNPLAYVLANLNAVQHDLRDRPELRDAADACEDARHGAERVRTIVRDLQTFSRAAPSSLAPTDLRAVVENALHLAANELQHRARVVRDYQALAPVHGDAARLGQLVLHLLVNAAHAIPAGDAARHEVRVRLRQAAGRAVLEVHDTGEGIPEQNLSRIFDPFFTTRPVGSGMGLGLSLCHTIVRDHGGDIAVESRPAGPTVFRITLPLSAAGAGVAPSPDRTQAPLTAGRRLLIIDDEPMVTRGIGRMLGAGYVVQTCGSGGEALQRLQQERVDLVLCDVMMPQMSAVEFSRQLASLPEGRRPPLLLMTGGAFTDEALRFLESSPYRCLQKPFRRDELLAAVEDTLRG